MATHQELGRWGERLAADLAEAQGMTVLDRNWRCAIGEIDVVARDQHEIVVIEVKTRRNTSFMSPIEAITAAKLRRLRQLGARWSAEHPEHSGPLRIDAVVVVGTPENEASATIERLTLV